MNTTLESSLEDFLRVQTEIANRQYGEMVNETAKHSLYKDHQVDKFLCDEESLLIAEGKLSPTIPQPEIDVIDPIDPLLFRYEDTILHLQGKTKKTTQWSKTPVQRKENSQIFDFFLCIAVLTTLFMGCILGVALLIIL